MSKSILTSISNKVALFLYTLFFMPSVLNYIDNSTTLASSPLYSRLSKIPFSHREIQIAPLVAFGLTNKEIAAKLSISPFTVMNHIANMKQKSNSKNKAELVCFIVKNELC